MAAGATSPDTSSAVLEPDQTAALSRLLGPSAEPVRLLSGGRNSRTLLARASGDLAVVKFYHRHPGDPRDRGRTEFTALRLLWNAGFRDAPEPLAAAPDFRAAAYAYVEGVPALSGPRPEDADALADFLARLRDLARSGADYPSPASEACFSPREAASAVRVRMDRLLACPADGDAHRRMRAFVAGELAPALERTEARLADLPGGAEACLPEDLRTLSPSDFGLHNALRRADGGLTFLDFEYFGRDDPAKTLCDVLLHPAPALPGPLKSRFVRGMLRAFADDAGLAARARALRPVHAAKWCCILLNEFLAQDLCRRTFAGAAGDGPDLLERQLAKSRAMLETLRREPFPAETEDHAHAHASA